MNVITLACLSVCLVAATFATPMHYGYQSYVPVHVGTGVSTTGSGFGFGSSGFGLGGTGGGLFDMIFFLFFFMIMINLLGSLGGNSFKIGGKTSDY